MDQIYTDPEMQSDNKLSYYVEEISDVQEKFAIVLNKCEKQMKLPVAKKEYKQPEQERKEDSDEDEEEKARVQKEMEEQMKTKQEEIKKKKEDERKRNEEERVLEEKKKRI